jgi:hypothetical protein
MGPMVNFKKRKYSGNVIAGKLEIFREVDVKENGMWSVEKVFILIKTIWWLYDDGAWFSL